MKRHKNSKIAALFLCAQVIAACGGEIRLNFLELEATREEIHTLLATNEIPEPATNEFLRLVRFHNEGGCGVATNMFPIRQNGEFKFQSVGDLTNRLDGPLGQTKGKPTLVCFDVVGLLLHGAGYGAEQVLDNFDMKEVVQVAPDGKAEPAKLDAFRKASGLLFPPNGYKALVGRERSEGETRLGLSLRAPRRIRKESVSSEEKVKLLFNKHVKALQSDGFKFPKKFQLGMVFFVNTNQGYMVADHAFLAFNQAEKLTTIEKFGSQGPYVRGQFATETDLAIYASFGVLACANDPHDRDFGALVIVSLNDRLIGIFPPTAP
ncbi:MAG: hypothetical protein QM813_04310 [Verrucomicrobiota bacterium]